jgi:hypothetical protein
MGWVADRAGMHLVHGVRVALHKNRSRDDGKFGFALGRLTSMSLMRCFVLNSKQWYQEVWIGCSEHFHVSVARCACS